MNYALSDFDLGYKQAKLMSLTFLDNYRQLGAIIRMLKDRIGEQRSYLKIMKFSFGRYSKCKADHVRSILNRLVKCKNGIYCAQDFTRIHLDIKTKYELVSYHYDYMNVAPKIPDLTPIPTHEAVNCVCCRSLFLEPIIKRELRRRFALCGVECGKIMRLHSRMTDTYKYFRPIKSKTVSSRYKSNVRKGKLPLLCFIDYLSSQQRRKANRNNKGKFTWG